jgi:hypothetical protein
MSSRLASIGTLLALTCVTSGAAAQFSADLGSPNDSNGNTAQPAATTEAAPVDETDPRELEDTEYFFLGAMYRHVFIPSFIQRVAPIQGGIEAQNPAAGLSFTYRRNNFSVSANAWWSGAQGEGYFRENGDPRTDTEYVLADLGVVFLSAEFLWAFPVVDWFAIELGFDLGLGVVYGGIERTEAYESSNGADDWRPCSGPGNPSGAYCEPPAPDPCYINAGGHYQCREPNWTTEGGDVPVVVPWLSVPHIALRFKPIRQVQIRIDGGWGIYNFFVGGSVSYGF